MASSKPRLQVSGRSTLFETGLSVGGTPLLRAEALERRLGVQGLYLKVEGANPTGTHKDRLAEAQVRIAKGAFPGVTVGTCGNHGVSLSRAAAAHGVPCVAFVPAGYTLHRQGELEGYGADIRLVHGPYEAAVEASRAFAEAVGYYDANPGSHDHVLLAARAYGRIADEIVAALGDAPATVSVSMGNGTTLTGCADGFARLKRRGRTTRIPRMIGATTASNAMAAAFNEGRTDVPDLDAGCLVETDVNEPLVGIHPYEGQYAMDAVRRTGGQIVTVDDATMTRYARVLVRAEGVASLPASCAAVAATVSTVTQMSAQGHGGNEVVAGPHVVVLTARRT